MVNFDTFREKKAFNLQKELSNDFFAYFIKIYFLILPFLNAYCFTKTSKFCHGFCTTDKI